MIQHLEINPMDLTYIFDMKLFVGMKTECKDSQDVLTRLLVILPSVDSELISTWSNPPTPTYFLHSDFAPENVSISHQIPLHAEFPCEENASSSALTSIMNPHWIPDLSPLYGTTASNRARILHRFNKEFHNETHIPYQNGCGHRCWIMPNTLQT